VRPYLQLRYGRSVREAEVPAALSWSPFERGLGRGRTAVRPYLQFLHGRPVREGEVPAALSWSPCARSRGALSFVMVAPCEKLDDLGISHASRA
jgi:hypothetical protein